jgi:2-hydroxy-3-keto-5-methylthiopentenyl-1-phosphate phosphatase
MSKQRKPRMAICYDFDKTLSPGNMQEYDFIPLLKIKPSAFWCEVKQRSREQNADDILVYMCLMLEKARAAKVKIQKTDFVEYGKKVKLFEGVTDWFSRINKFADDNGVILEHYVISSGIREMIEGTPIAKEFERIYASSFMYDQYDVAEWPGLAINYTTKTQFLFRINKGQLDIWDNDKMNAFVHEQDRPVPFSRMIYIGDGTSDVPCMKLVKEQRGHSLAVYKPDSSKKAAEKLLTENRVHFIAPADYREGKLIDSQVKAVIEKISADFKVQKYIPKGNHILVNKIAKKPDSKSVVKENDEDSRKRIRLVDAEGQ